MLTARALWSAADAYSFESARRIRSLTNGIVSAANFSLEAIGGGEGGGAATVFVDAGAGAETAEGARAGAALLLEAPDPSCFSSLVKYRKPPTPMATIHTAATGHIQFGVTAAAAGFFNCGTA